MEQECVVCSVHLAHFKHEPMSMGCRCASRVCRICVERGELKACPMCRVHRSRPSIDRKWRATLSDWLGHRTVPCLGCSREFGALGLRSHERTCARYRDHMEAMLRSDVDTLRARVNQMDEEKHQLDEQVELQQDAIETLEEECDHLEAVIRGHEMERQLFDYEMLQFRKTLTLLTRPLQTLCTKATASLQRVQALRLTVDEARRGHRELQRKRTRGEMEEDDDDDDDAEQEQQAQT